MKILQSEYGKDLVLPMELNISFEKVFTYYKKYAEDETHPYHESAKSMVAEFEKYPELHEGFTDFSLLEKFAEPISLMLDPLFPEPLLDNEIKSVCIPFDFTSFKFSSRFAKIIDNAGPDFKFQIRNFEDDLLYISACTMILSKLCGYNVDLKRPFFFDIPNTKTGITHHYRAAFNGDFAEVEATENAPPITDEDVKLLLNNFDNIDLWKAKFPPNSYKLKGFGLINLFDVTIDEILSSLKNILLERGEDLLDNLQHNLSQYFGIKDLKVGFSVYDKRRKKLLPALVKNSESLILAGESEISCGQFFCDCVTHEVFLQHKSKTITDIEQYKKDVGANGFYKALKKKNIASIIIIPLKIDDDDIVVLLEIGAPGAYDLNTVNENKLKDVIPVFEAAVKNTSEDHHNKLEATIQENYTAIHPTVKWRFYEAAENYHRNLLSSNETPVLEEIVFRNTFPLYGQSDIKGSSIARNNAIRRDLTTQLKLAVKVLNKACQTEKLPIYEEMTFRVNQYLDEVDSGLKAGDEVSIIDFLKRDIYPVFEHIKSVNNDLSKSVEKYMARIDKELQVVYEYRKDYENSVTLLNEHLARYLDHKQEEAQKMFPHYYERYKTDGVEYNMYIGQSLTEQAKFDPLYLYNLRLWQLQAMCEMENIAYNLLENMDQELRVASLILVHSNPLAIKFRMDEKQFDVDGAYNIRYEIIKKRIDKAHIKGTTERLTVPGKIAIVYSQEKDAVEYLKYIKYLQSKDLLGTVEKLDLEDLQGVSGLKALRVEVRYHEKFNEKDHLALEKMLKEVAL